MNPGPADASTTVADVSNGTLLSPVTITVRTRDRFGNPLTEGGEQVQITVIGGGQRTPLTVTDQQDGTYTGSFAPLLPGTYDIEITLNGTPIRGSPYQALVGSS